MNNNLTTFASQILHFFLNRFTWPSRTGTRQSVIGLGCHCTVQAEHFLIQHLFTPEYVWDQRLVWRVIDSHQSLDCLSHNNDLLLHTRYKICQHTRHSKLILELSSFFKNLHTVIVCISNNNIFIHAKTEAMRRIELAFAWTQLAKFTPTRRKQNDNSKIVPSRITFYGMNAHVRTHKTQINVL